MYKQWLGAVGILLLFGGCSMKEAPPIVYYSLNGGTPPLCQKSRYRDKVIEISYPQTLTERIGNRMRFSYSSSERGSYQNARWSNTLERLLQGSIVMGLESCRCFKAVLLYSSTAQVDLRLESMIYDFSHHVRGDASYAVVSIGLMLIDTHTGRLLKSRRFSYREETPSVDAKGYVTASDRAMQRLMRDMAAWLR